MVIKTIFIAFTLFILSVSNGYAQELVCFETETAASLAMEISIGRIAINQYGECSNALINQESIVQNLNGILNATTVKYNEAIELNVFYQDQLDTTRNQCNDRVKRNQDVCEQQIKAASPSFIDKLLWAGAGSGLSLLVILIIAL